ncbi:MAG TPA: hypothetical protein VK742_05515 [Candidatus Sulfotelmatobacter sp.]|jgi:hypothetical protein|nr:hypothetical protein [Candidatus Sulfotelmatobacter sp.]
MNTNSPKDDVGPDNSGSPDTITLKMIKDRAVEIAWINGRAARDLKPSDYVEAKRDLMGQLGIDPQPATLESEPESEPPDAVPDPAGDEKPAPGSQDEHDAGRSDN